MNALTINFEDRSVRIELEGVGQFGNLLDATGVISRISEFAAEPVARRTKQDVGGGAVVVDSATGLMWDASTTASEKTWSEAEAAAKALRLGGYDDWRLPTLDELESIRDITKYNPAIDTGLFADTKSTYYWTASPAASGPDCAWIVNFYHGHAYLYNRSYRCAVRAVRSLSRASQ